MIGIVGGAGPLASALLYQLVVEEYYVRGIAQPEILLLNHSFPRGLTLEESIQNQARLEEELQACLELLIQAGASVVCIACNTLHDFLKGPFEVPLIHLPEKVMGALQKEKMKKVGVLCTETTRHSSLYQAEGVTFHYPSESGQRSLNLVLDRILEGRVLQEDSVRIHKLIMEMKEEQGIHGVVLGCTDLSLLNYRYPLHCEGVRLFDSIKILAKEL